MANRRKIVIANWKMNGRLTSGLNLVRVVAENAIVARPLTFDLVICPPATLVWPVAEALMDAPVFVGGQDCHTANHGAYTGDVSAGMLADLGCRYVILGHSERRSGHQETNALVAQKVAAAQLAGLICVVCVGESVEQRSSGKTEEAVTNQVMESLPSSYRPDQLIIAYEPLWAIGSGQTPSVEEIKTVHKAIRKALGTMGQTIRIIYGGSVVIKNAGDILREQEIDGVLVGSASMSAEAFWGIAEKCMNPVEG